MVLAFGRHRECDSHLIVECDQRELVTRLQVVVKQSFKLSHCHIKSLASHCFTVKGQSSLTLRALHHEDDFLLVLAHFLLLYQQVWHLV